MRAVLLLPGHASSRVHAGHHPSHRPLKFPRPSSSCFCKIASASAKTRRCTLQDAARDSEKITVSVSEACSWRTGVQLITGPHTAFALYGHELLNSGLAQSSSAILWCRSRASANCQIGQTTWPLACVRFRFRALAFACPGRAF